MINHLTLISLNGKLFPKSQIFKVHLKKWILNYLTPFLYLLNLISIPHALIVTPPLTSKSYSMNFCQNVTLKLQKPIKLEVF